MRESVTQTMAASEAKRNWSKIINKAFSGQARFVVQKHGIPVAGIVSADDVERLAELDAQRARDFEILDRVGQAFRDQSPEEIQAAVTKALAEVRSESRSQGGRRATPG